MIKVIRSDAGRVEIGGIERAAASERATLWVHLQAPTADELTWLGQRFGFDALALEDLSHQRQRAKVEEFEGYVFLVVHALDAGARAVDLSTVELEAFLAERLIVTSATATIPALEAVWQRASADPTLLERGADLTLHAVCDGMIDSAFDLLDALSDEVESLEDLVIEGRTGRAEIARIFDVKAALVTARKAISPQREVFNFLSHRSTKCVSERGGLFFRDVHDHLTRLYEQIDTARDLIGNVLDAYLSMVAQRTNEQMKKLTVLSAIFLPVTAITGIFGMNLELLPIRGLAPAVFAAALLVLTPASMFALVRWLRWF